MGHFPWLCYIAGWYVIYIYIIKNDPAHQIWWIALHEAVLSSEAFLFLFIKMKTPKILHNFGLLLMRIPSKMKHWLQVIPIYCSFIFICRDDDPSWYIIFDIVLWLLSHWRCYVQCPSQQLLRRVSFEKAQELPRRRAATATVAMPCQSLALATMTMLSWPVMSAPVAVIGCNPYVTGTTGLLKKMNTYNYFKFNYNITIINHIYIYI